MIEIAISRNPTRISIAITARRPLEIAYAACVVDFER